MPAETPADALETVPFYDPGTRLPSPKGEPSRIILPQRSVSLATTAGVNATQILLPASESSGALIEPFAYFGLMAVGVEAGYSNLAGQSGLLFGLSLLRYMPGATVFKADGWLGSVVAPDINVLARWYPGLPGTQPFLVPGVHTDGLGFRVAKCIGSMSLQTTLRAPTLGAAAVMYDDPTTDAEFGAIVGASLEVGFVFGNKAKPASE